MRKFSKVLVLFFAFALTIMLSACGKIELSFENPEITIVAGQEEELVPISNKEDLELLWESDDETIVTVNNGTILGVNPGEATVKVSVKDKEDIFATITVKVNPVTITITPATVTVVLDQEMTITPVVTPQQAITYTWTSSNTDIVTVTNGKIKGVAVGEATVTATGKGGNASIVVTVVLPDPTTVGITNAPTNAKVNDVITLQAQVIPIKASQEVIWSTSDAEIAEITPQGRVTFVGIGEVTITATSKVKGTVKGIATIDVGAPDPQTIAITAPSTEVIINETLQLSASVSPDLSNQGVTWSSSDSTIATISAAGLLTAHKVGVVTITATSEVLSSVTNTIEITVKLPAPTGVQVTGAETVIQIDEELQLTSNVLPNLANQSVTFTSSNDAVATVSATGLVTGVTAGNVIITVTSTVDGLIQGNYTMKVVEKIDEITHDNIVVDAALASKARYDVVTYNEVDYYVGVNAFADFGKVTAKEGAIINVLAGTYSQVLAITANNVEVIGPNVDINPNSGTRVAEAIMTAKITLATGIDGFTINGLAFTGNGAVQALGTAKNVLFTNNTVYNTTQTTAAWSALRDYNLVGFFTFWKQAIAVENITVENNKFDRVSGPNIMVGNTTNVTVKGNVFTNFDRDAIRIDGGYNYGLTLIENNTFENSTLSGYNGIYFRSVGHAKDSDKPHVVEVKNNTFKNIGQISNEVAMEMTGAITSNGYQEFGVTYKITNNIFETCANYLYLRNNATAANHAAYQWVGNVNFNIFKGAPVGYYHRNRNATDTATTNPALVNFDSNFFGDVNGNFIEVDDAKFNYVGSLDFTYFNIEDMTAFYVDGSIEAEDGAEVVVYGQTLIFGEKAFSSIADAVTTAPANSVIVVLPGTYNEEVTITKALKLRTLNSNLNPTVDDTPFKDDSDTATTITGIWYANASNIQIKGFSFTGTARVRSYGQNGSWSNLLYENNYAYDTTDATLAWKQTAYSAYGVTGANDTLTPGFINLAPNGKWLYNYTFRNNKFSNVSDTNIFMICVNNVTIEGNVFEDADRDAIRLDYASVGGVLNIKNNTFTNVKYNGLYIRTYTGTYADPVKAYIYNNHFKNVGAAGATETPASTRIGAIATAGYAEAKDAEFFIRFNIFEDCTNYISLRDNVTNVSTWTKLWAAHIEYNAFIDTDGVTNYFKSLLGASDTVTTNTGNTLINHNFYGTDVNTAATTTEAQFCHHLKDLSNTVVYTTKAELDAAIITALTPANIEVTGTVTELKGIETTQLTAKVLPALAPQAVVWSSSDPTVAIVSATGLVTALKPGTATIYATAKDLDTVVGEYEITVAGVVATHILVDASLAEAEELTKIVEGGKTYYLGVNAFATLTAAVALLEDGSTLTLKAGTYDEAVTINNNNVKIYGPNKDVSPVTKLDERVAEASITQKITLGEIENLIVNGIELTKKGVIHSDKPLKNIVISYLHAFANQTGDGSQGVIYLKINADDKVNENIKVTESYFKDATNGFRGVRVNNAKDLEITNCYFYGYFDAIRLEGTANSGWGLPGTGSGATGSILITDNYFENNNQYPICFGRWTATSVEIHRNHLGVNPASTGTFGLIYLNNYISGDYKSIVNITHNYAPYNTEYHEYRFRAADTTADQLEINVNFNTWAEAPLVENEVPYKHVINHSETITVNAKYNIFIEEPLATYFDYAEYLPFFRTEQEMIDYFFEFDITYQLNGGTLSDDAITVYYKQTLPYTLLEPEKTGYTFGGWFDNDTFTGDAITVLGLDTTGDLELFAKWIPIDYTVAFELNDGTFGYASKEEMLIDFLTDFYNYISPSGVSLSDFMHGTGNTSGFDGIWHSNATYKAKIYSGPRPVQVNEAYFASSSAYMDKWLPFFDTVDEFVKTVNNTQYFWGAGTSTGLIRIRQYVCNIKPASYVTDATMAMMPADFSTAHITSYTIAHGFAMPAVYREGYTFEGWYEASDFSGDVVTAFVAGNTGNKTFYAKWTEVESD